MAIADYQLPQSWDEAVLKETEGLLPHLSDEDRKDRRDCRHIPLITIDGEDAKDFDDAVYCEKQGSQWRLIVAIADVSHYVRPGTALDDAAKERGNSVYFPGYVVPMLPKILANSFVP